jgi:hypothetical protein
MWWDRFAWIAIFFLLLYAIDSFVKYKNKREETHFMRGVLSIGVSIILFPVAKKLTEPFSSICISVGSTIVSISVLSIIFEKIFIQEILKEAANRWTKILEEKVTINNEKIINFIKEEIEKQRRSILNDWKSNFLKENINEKLSYSIDLLSSIYQQAEWNEFTTDYINKLKTIVDKNPLILINPSFDIVIRRLNKYLVMKEITQNRQVILLRDLHIQEIIENLYSRIIWQECEEAEAKIKELRITSEENDFNLFLNEEDIKNLFYFTEELTNENYNNYKKRTVISLNNQYLEYITTIQELKTTIKKGSRLQVSSKEYRIGCLRNTKGAIANKYFYRLKHIAKNLHVSCTVLDGKLTIVGTAYGNNVLKDNHNINISNMTDGKNLSMNITGWLLPGNGFILVLDEDKVSC